MAKLAVSLAFEASDTAARCVVVLVNTVVSGTFLREKRVLSVDQVLMTVQH